MFQFKIFLVEVDDDETITGRELWKMVSRLTIPRLKEHISFDGNAYQVTEVSHEMDEEPTSPEAICVSVNWWRVDFIKLSEDLSWTKVGFNK